MKQIKYHRILKSVKQVSIIIFLLILSKIEGQQVFDFEKNSAIEQWSQSPSKPWAISDESAISGKFSLHHIYNSEEAGLDQISYFFPALPDLNENISWSFMLKHAYNPSTSNNWAIFLASNSPYSEMYPNSNAEAIILGVNYIGSDDCLTLWKQSNGEILEITKMPLNWEEKIKDSTILIAIARSPQSQWLLKVYNNKGEQISSCAGWENFFPTPCYFGISYKYTAAQDQKFWFDDFSFLANFKNDSIPPYIDTCFFTNKKELLVDFSEHINFEKITAANFFTNSNQIISVKKLSPDKCKLTFSDDLLNNDSLQIIVNNIFDLYGNSTKTAIYNVFFHIPQKLDIVISEIMYDPEPQVQLPPHEYIELFNKSKFTVNLTNWELIIGNNTFKFPSVTLKPDSFLIVTQKDIGYLFRQYGKTIGLFSNSSTLLNEGGIVILKDSLKNIIAASNYKSNWYSGYKSDGGWSLEMIDPENTCNSITNLIFSVHPTGGTPGSNNSVYAKNADNINPLIEKIRVLSDTSIVLHFSEPLISDSIFSPYSYICDNGVSFPSRISTETNDFTSYLLTFKKAFFFDKKYTLRVTENICDCAGNPLSTDTISFFLPQMPQENEIVFNEILFNPYPNGSKFIELYNRSKNIIDGSKILLLQFDTMNNEVIFSSKILPTGTLFYPGSYACITDEIENIKQFYTIKNEKTLYRIEKFPVLNDKQGLLAIKDINYKQLDSVYYSHTFHTSFLPSNEGVSIERLSPEISSLYSSNWQSAAETAGFATPGSQNSRTLPNNKFKKEIKLEPEVFSPNSDGNNDLIFISLPHIEEPMTASIYIYNSSGILVKYLLQNKYTEPGYIQSWDGSNNNGQKATSGIYIVYIRYILENGETNEIKKTCVLSRF